MTASAQESAAASSAADRRPRPRVHFTAAEGWINDPYGITWVEDRYRMFYQAMPDRTTWGEACAWGTAESPDLIRWRELPLALQPQAFEVGCWSGTALLTAAPPRLFYTRIADENWANGVIATATSDASLQKWTTGADDVVVPGAPPELGVTTLRDSFVLRYAHQWIMIVGAGLADGSGAAVQFRSDDLVTWACDGLLSSRAWDADGVRTGQVWECPQLFPLGQDWVLLVSVWIEDELYYVAAGIGDYDGRRFQARSWQQLTYGSSAYAMTAFLDREDRRCVLSWLREEPRNAPDRVGWVGAHSVAAVLTLDLNGRLVLSPHPDLAQAGSRASGPAAVDGALRVPIPTGAAEVTLGPVVGTALSVVADAGELLRIGFGQDHLVISRPDRAVDQMPVDTSQPLVILIDADIVEVFGPSGYGAFRIGAASDAMTTELAFSAAPREISVRTL